MAVTFQNPEDLQDVVFVVRQKKHDLFNRRGDDLGVLPRVAACCSILQRVAVCCSVLQCVAACCIVKWYLWLVRRNMIFSIVVATILVCCSVLQRVAACCSVLQHVAACCNVLQRVAV